MRPHGDCVLLSLPPHLSACDADLRAAAARIFHAAPVRSVTVNRRRTAAVVRLAAGTASQAATSQSACSLIGDAVASPALPLTQPMELVSWVDTRDGSVSFIKMPARVAGWRRAMYLALAGAALSLGLLGIALPGLPTTPFVLLGSYFLVRSSTRLHERLMASRLFGGVLRDWYVHRGLRPHVRARAVAVVAIVVAVSLLAARPTWPITLVIGALAACGLTVIWRLPSVKEMESFKEGDFI